MARSTVASRTSLVAHPYSTPVVDFDERQARASSFVASGFDVWPAALYVDAMKTSRVLIVVMCVLAAATSVWAGDRADMVESQKELAAQGYSWAQAALGYRYSHG